MLYDKKIRYLDYFEGGRRIRGAGCVKLEERDENLRMELMVTGLHPTDSFSRDVILCMENSEKEIGKIELSGGRGNYRQQWNRPEEMGGTGYEILRGIRIPLGAGREISCIWQEQSRAAGGTDLRAAESEKAEKKKREDKEGLKRIEPESDKARAEREGEAADKAEIKQTEDGSGKIRSKQEEEAPGRTAEKTPGERRNSAEVSADIFRLTKIQEEPKAVRRTPIPEEEPEEARRNAQTRGQNPSRKVKLLEDKWAQLWSIYPHIHPFRDGREYLSIGPADFVLFSGDSYRQVNNSFLLHGYYNYNHLILARIEKKGEKLYYVGVPGTYYEREKQVAIMFGFESFECAEEPAQTGDFGYYMMRTQI